MITVNAKALAALVALSMVLMVFAAYLVGRQAGTSQYHKVRSHSRYYYHSYGNYGSR